MDTRDTPDPRSPDAFPPGGLELETQRLRRLARGLVHGDHDAEDVVQQAWLLSLSRGGAAPRSLRAWLVGTVRRMADTAARSEARRHRRERAVAATEREVDGRRSLEHIELLQQVLAALERLEEPFRHTLALRFLEDVPVPEIARREGIPVDTVHSRVRRGLERLRRALTGGDEDRRRDLLAALAPLAGALHPPGALLAARAAGTHVAKGLAVKSQTRWILPLAAVLLFGAGTLATVTRRRMAGPTPAPPSSASLATAPSEVEVPGVAEPPAAREAAAPARPAGTWIVRGTVVTAGENAPLAGVALATRLLEGPDEDGDKLAEGSPVSDERGRFEWALEPPDRLVTLTVVAVGGERFSYVASMTVPAGDGPPQDLLVRVYPLDVTLTGRVLAPTGEPVPEARVAGFHGEDGVRTDPGGRFRLATSSAVETRSVQVVADGFRETAVPVLVREAGDHALGDVVLEPSGALRGQLFDASGTPLAGARVEVWNTLAWTRTDAEGRFRLSTLPTPPEQVWLRATETGVCDHFRAVEPDELQASELAWVLPRATAVRGTVRDESGAAVAGAQVVLAYSPNSLPREVVWSAADGTFEFAALAPSLDETALWAGRAGYRWTSRPIAIPDSSEASAPVELVLQRAHTIAGQVLDPRGKPVPRAYVHIASTARDQYVEATHSDDEGRFRITGLPAGSVRLGFLARGFLRHVERVEVDLEGVLVRLSRSGGLAGRVLDGLSGEPIPRFRLRFVEPIAAEGDQRLLGYAAVWTSAQGVLRTDDAGTWTIDDEDFEPGSVIGLEVSAEGYAPALVDRAVVELEPDPDALEVRLYRTSAQVEGRVTEAGAGTPVANATVCALRDGAPAEGAPSARTDGNGRFVLEDLPVGLTSLLVTCPGLVAQLDGPFDVPPTGRVQRAIELSAGGTLEGRLLDAAGEPLGGERIELHPGEVDSPSRSKLQCTTGAEGHYAFSGLAGGTHTLLWSQDMGGESIYALQREVTVVDGKRATCDLRPRGHATVRGRLRFEGEAPASVRVVLFPLRAGADDARLSHQTIAAQGRFLVEGVEGGSYIVYVRDRLVGIGEEMLEVPADGEVEVSVEVRRPGK